MGITVKEFALKYDVPYQVVNNAKYDCTCYNGYRRRGREYNERELFEKTERLIRTNIRRHLEKAEIWRERLAKLNGQG